jgi:hypothetical protein
MQTPLLSLIMSRGFCFISLVVYSVLEPSNGRSADVLPDQPRSGSCNWK